MVGEYDFDPEEHFFCVSRSSKPYGDVKDWGYFASFEDARGNACNFVPRYPYAWLMERGSACGRRDDWMIFWWSDNLADLHNYPHQREHYGRGYFADETEGLSDATRASMHDYIPLDPNWRNRHNAEHFIKL